MENYNTKGYRYICLLVALVLFAGLLPTSTAYAAEAAGEDAVDSLDWQKTLDRHPLLATAYGNNTYVAVGDDGVIKLSEDGEKWMLASHGSLSLQSVAWGGGSFVAVGNQGRILISEDGRNWKEVDSGTDKNLKDVVWNGSVFVAAGDRGTLLVSKNKITWTKVALDQEYSFAEMASGGGRLILTTSDTFNNIWISNDNGTNWKKVTPSGENYGYGNVAYNGTAFIMTGKLPHQGGSIMLTSENGENWTVIENAPDMKSVTAHGGGFIGIGYSVSDSNGTITQPLYLSDDGVNWQTKQLKWRADHELKSIISCGLKLIGLNYRGEIFYSAGGLNWIRESSGLESAYDSIAWDGGQFVAYNSLGSMAVSKDGSEWTKSAVKLTMDQPIRKLFYLNRGLIAVIAGDPSKLYVSKDGSNWTDYAFDGLDYAKVINAGAHYLLDTGNELYLSTDGAHWEKTDATSASLSAMSIAYDGKTYVSVGGRGIVYGGEGNHSEPVRVIGTSEDLRSWETTKSENTQALNSVVWAKGRFVAVGDRGTILASADGLSGWTQADSGTSNDLNHIVWDGTRFIAAGVKGTILYSVDGISWIKGKSLTSDSIQRIIVHGKQYYTLASNTILKGTGTTAAQTDRFSDIDKHWARSDINELAGRGLINGVGGNRFAPDQNMSRAEFAAIITRALNLSASEKPVQFHDVKATDWYYESISAAFENGIIKGYGQNLIKPGRNISREEAMAMMARALKLSGHNVNLTEQEVSDALKSFKDRDQISKWAEETAFFVKKGLIKGSNGQIEPGDEITRAETAAIVLRILKLQNN